jgi:hypothetical protein
VLLLLDELSMGLSPKLVEVIGSTLQRGLGACVASLIRSAQAGTPPSDMLSSN